MHIFASPEVQFNQTTFQLDFKLARKVSRERHSLNGICPTHLLFLTELKSLRAMSKEIGCLPNGKY